MKIQYVSDLHLEFRGKNFKNLFKNEGDILCLAGDISALGNKEEFINFVEFIKYISSKYIHIFHVAGNHEYYTAGEKEINKYHTITYLNSKIKKIEKIIPNYSYLNMTVKKMCLGKKIYVFIGATLWANIKPEDFKSVEKYMNDYNYIYTFKNGKPTKLTAADVLQMHKIHKKFIKNADENLAKNEIGILITHHKPVADSTNIDILTQAYESDLSSEISKIKLAIHGHTHKYYDKTINNTRYVSNPKGYIKQKTKFLENKIIEL